MISRRNIRVTVMQALYVIDSLKDQIKPGEEITIFNKKINQTKHLLVYTTNFIVELARYVERDALNRANKLLPTAEDLALNTKLAGNEIIWQILEKPGFKTSVESYKADVDVDYELIKKLYTNLTATPEYNEYINEQSRNKTTEKEILLFIWQELVLPNEDFIAHIEEKFINWEDDGEMINQLMLSMLQKPKSADFIAIVTADKLEFGKQLLETVLAKTEHSRELIKPKLKNWDADRIATLDMLLLQMGICEFLFFETIPTKVTINEYIDIAKAYSTPQSGMFVNGILDGLHKDLLAQNKITKINFTKN
jgi:transcription antitermination protein NusB